MVLKLEITNKLTRWFYTFLMTKESVASLHQILQSLFQPFDEDECSFKRVLTCLLMNITAMILIRTEESFVKAGLGICLLKLNQAPRYLRFPW